APGGLIDFDPPDLDGRARARSVQIQRALYAEVRIKRAERTVVIQIHRNKRPVISAKFDGEVHGSHVHAVVENGDRALPAAAVGEVGDYKRRLLRKAQSRG